MPRRRHPNEPDQVANILKSILKNTNLKNSNNSKNHNNQQQHRKNNQHRNQPPDKEGGQPKSGRNNKWNLALPHVPNLTARPNKSSTSTQRNRRRSSLLEQLWSVIDKQFPDPPDPGIDPSDDLELPDADQTVPEIDLQSICVDLSWTLLALSDRLFTFEVVHRNCDVAFGALRTVSIMATTMLDQFLAGIADLVSRRQGDHLQDYLQVVPERMRDGYRLMANELQANYPKGPGDEALFKRCESLVPKNPDGTSAWPAFPVFIRSYLAYLRDANVSNPLEAYKAMNVLLNQCVQALGDSQMGAIVLRTVVYLSQIVAGLAVTLEKNQQFLAQLRADEPQDAFQRSSLVEDAANVVREGFIKCLTDRAGTTGTKGKPEGKRAGIYLMVNQCLKLLYRCGNLRSADTIFKSIVAQSPPLDYYPAAQRVTYLYYLGRYLLANNQFFLAQLALWEAYMQCHVSCIRQKRHILIYLISCNIVMGRFPSLHLLQKPEAEGLYDIFVPLCQLIRSGDYLSFRDHFKLGTPIAQWYLKKGLLYQLRNRCELLVWRSLVRKVFIYGGFHGDPTAQRSPPPMLHLSKLETAVRFIQARHNGNTGTTSSTTEMKESNTFTLDVTRDTDYDAIADFVSKIPQPNNASEDADYLYAAGYFDANGVWIDNPDRQRIPGHQEEEYSGDLNDLLPYVNGYSEGEHTSKLLQDIESIVASLIKQNLLGGYLTHNPARFVIPGAKHVGAMAKGFPNIWQTISSQQERYGDVVPAWVIARHAMPEQPALANVGGGGRIVNLKGAKAVGS